MEARSGGEEDDGGLKMRVGDGGEWRWVEMGGGDEVGDGVEMRGFEIRSEMGVGDDGLEMRLEMGWMRLEMAGGWLLGVASWVGKGGGRCFDSGETAPDRRP